MNDMNEGGGRPLYVKVKAERKRQMVTNRNMTQQYVADEAGMKKRAYQYFESGKHTPQPKHLAGILRTLGLDENGDPVGGATVHELPTTVGRFVQWPEDIDAFLNMWGLFLETKDEPERTDIMYEASRWIVDRQRNRN